MGLVILMLAAGLAAQATVETPRTAGVAPKAEAAKQVCVTETQLGSHRKRRVCATQEEWDKRQRHDQGLRSKPITKPPSEGAVFKAG